MDGLLKEAARSLYGISGIDVMSSTAAVKESEITAYRASVDIAFLVEKGKRYHAPHAPTQAPHTSEHAADPAGGARD